MSQAHAISFAEIKALMQADILQLARAWAPLGRRDGQYWTGPNPSRGEIKGTSFKIWMTGAAIGAWKEFDSGETEKGDLIDLPIYIGVFRDKAELREWAMRRYGLKDGDPAAVERVRRETRSKVRRAEEDDARDRQRKIDLARKTFAAKGLITPGTAARAYLETHRGLRLSGLSRDGRDVADFMPDLRADTACHWVAPDGARDSLPAMLAAMRAADGQIMAVHRTYLDPTTHNKITTGPAKKMLGVTRATAIRVWPGDGNFDVLVLTEGIEDALTIATAEPGHACWAVGSLNGLATFDLPLDLARPGRIIVFADNDWSGGPAAKGFAQAMRRMRTLGVPVFEARSHAGKDANDLLMRERTR